MLSLGTALMLVGGMILVLIVGETMLSDGGQQPPGPP